MSAGQNNVKTEKNKSKSQRRELCKDKYFYKLKMLSHNQFDKQTKANYFLYEKETVSLTTKPLMPSAA